VEAQDHPVLVSTSRHIRQMAFDIKDLGYDGPRRVLRGTSRAVAGDPYQLRIWLPESFSPQRVEVSGGIVAGMRKEGSLLLVEFTAESGEDVDWKVYF
jgi:hypothetical protein